MSTPRPLQQQVVALCLSAIVTGGVVAGLLQEAASQPLTLLAQQPLPTPHPVATMLVALKT